MQGKVSLEKKAVLSGVEAKYWSAIGNLAKAEEFAQGALSHRRSPTSLGMLAKIEAARFREAEQNGLSAMAELHTGSEQSN